MTQKHRALDGLENLAQANIFEMRSLANLPLGVIRISKVALALIDPSFKLIENEEDLGWKRT
jgi:hypothetical protein